MFNLIKKLFRIQNESKDLQTVPLSPSISSDISIPEPTLSLLWFTKEDTSKIASYGGLSITISFSLEGAKTKIDDGRNFFGEPSLIWTKLPIEKNNDLEEKPMYYPSYSALYPRNRFQYLNWLQDVTAPTNLSYVFLYFYGLERHLMMGNYDGAVVEVLRLLKHHNKGTFHAYAKQSLLIATLCRKRFDILSKSSELSEGLTNEILLTRSYLGKDLTAKEVIALASSVGFKNKRYIKMYPDKFESILSTNMLLFTNKNGPLISQIHIEDLKSELMTSFANMSLPEKYKSVPIPQLLSDERFKSALRTLLQNTHDAIK